MYESSVCTVTEIISFEWSQTILLQFDKRNQVNVQNTFRASQVSLRLNYVIALLCVLVKNYRLNVRDVTRTQHSQKDELHHRTRLGENESYGQRFNHLPFVCRPSRHELSNQS